MTNTIPDNLQPDAIIRSPLFPEPVRLIATIPMGDNIKLIGTGLETNQTYQPILALTELDTLVISPAQRPFTGNVSRFRLGVAALRLGLAYELERPDYKDKAGRRWSSWAGRSSEMGRCSITK